MYEHSLQEKEWNHFKLKYSQQTVSAAEVTANCALRRQYCGFSTAVLNVGRLGKFGWRAHGAFKEDVVYVFTVPDISNTSIVINIFTYCFQSHICECFNFSSCSIKINMSKNSVKGLQGVSLLQLILAEKTDWEVGLGPCNTWFSYFYWSKVQSYVRNLTLLYVLNISGGMIVLKEALY